MRLSPDAIRSIERVKLFIRWNAEHFDVLDEDHPETVNAFGWRRGQGEDREWWIKPEIWQGELCGAEANPQDVARMLKELGLLRTRDESEFQIVVNIRGRSARAYVIRDAILTWRQPVTGPHYSDYGSSPLGEDYGVKGPTTLISSTPDGSITPSDLAGKLELVVGNALDEALAILRLRPETDDRAYRAILRAKTTILGSALNTQVRVDGERMTQQRHDAAMAKVAELIEEYRQRQAAETPSSIGAT